MASVITDRFGNGQSTAAAVKLPVKGLSTTDITLSGEQTLNSIALVDGDRWCKAMPAGSVDSGIYIVRTGAWDRAPDFDGSGDVVQGTMILVAPGTADEQFWFVKTASPIYPGTTSILIERDTLQELALRADLASTAGAGMVGVIASGAGAAARVVSSKLSDYLTIQDYGGVGDGIADDSAAVTNAAAAAVSQKRVLYVQGHFRCASQPVFPAKLTMLGGGWTDDNSSVSRSISCLIKDFNGVGFLFAGDNIHSDGIQYDSAAARTGDVIQVTGSRVTLRNGSSTNGGNDGVRIGASEAGASSINANCGVLENWISIGNGRDGVNIDHTNTSTSATFPLGAPDVNAWTIKHLSTGSQTRQNGRDGLRLGNVIDTKLINVISQHNTEYGVRLTTSARGNIFFGVYLEGNTSGGCVFDSGAARNYIYGTSSVITGQAPVDNDGRNLIHQSTPDSSIDSVYQNFLNVANKSAAGSARVSFWADTGSIEAARIYADQSSGSRGRLKIATKTDGGAMADRIIIDGELGLSFNSPGGIVVNKTTFSNVDPGCYFEPSSGRINISNAGTGAATAIGFYNNSGVQCGSVSTSGTTTTYATTSDYRAKHIKNVADARNSRHRIDAVKIYDFLWKSTGEAGRGVVAHELQEVMPTAVVGVKDADELQAVDYSALIPDMIVMLQDQQRKIDNLEERLGIV